jgi:hypothetical protein|tara:strand:+ start:366 stop:566 length:201 start_codon:yes stop_codon:yes gene_type:complete
MATSKNDITGESIRTKGTLSAQGRDNYDSIFRKKEDKEPVETKEETPIKNNTPPLPNGLARHWNKD